MKISSGNMTIDLNIFNLGNQSNEPYELTSEVSAIHDNVEIEAMDFNNKLEYDYENLFQNVSNKIQETHSFGPLAIDSETCPTSSVKESPVLELKPLPNNLKCAYLGDNETFPVIISVDLSLEQENTLLSTLKKYKDAIG